MAYQRQANRVDSNQAEMDAAARKMGAKVVPMTGDGSIGFDRIYAKAGQVFLVEVKDGAKPPSKRKTTDVENKRAADLAEVGVTVHVVCNEEELAALLGRDKKSLPAHGGG